MSYGCLNMGVTKNGMVLSEKTVPNLPHWLAIDIIIPGENNHEALPLPGFPLSFQATPATLKNLAHWTGWRLPPSCSCRSVPIWPPVWLSDLVLQVIWGVIETYRNTSKYHIWWYEYQYIYIYIYLSLSLIVILCHQNTRVLTHTNIPFKDHVMLRCSFRAQWISILRIAHDDDVCPWGKS